MKARTVFGLVTATMATVCLTALIHRLFWGLSSHTIAGENFFAYLTVQSNFAFTALLIVASILAFRHADDPPWLTAALAMALTWTTTSGLAFALIVWQAGLRGIRVDVPWSDQVLHFWLPACAIVVWIFAPGHRRVPWWVVPVALVYPLLWGGVTMLRGPVVGWYPYYFLDLRQVGAVEFLISSAIALTIFGVIAVVLVLLSRVRPLGPRPA